MPFIDAATTEFGQSLPPHGPHTITTHGHGYKTAVAFREGDMSVISRIKSIYPRFSPFGLAAQVSRSLFQSRTTHAYTASPLAPFGPSI